MNVGSGRDDEGSSSEEDSDEEMVADAQEVEHVETSEKNPIEIRKTHMETRRLQRETSGTQKTTYPRKESCTTRKEIYHAGAWCPVCV